MKLSFDPKILIAHRRDKYWTQEDLAAASGVSTRTIQRVERSGGGSLETWKALAAAFDVDVKTFELESGSQRWSEKRTKLGYITMGYAITVSVIGSVVPWIPIIDNLNHGTRLAQLLPFFILAIAMPITFAIILTWTWRHLNRMSATI